MICIDKKILGTPSHMIQLCPNGEIAWVSDVPPTAYFLSEGPGALSLSDVFRLVDSQIPSLIPTNHIESFRELGINSCEGIPWHHVLSKHVFQEKVYNLLSCSWNSLSELKKTGYDEVYIAHSEFLKLFRPSKINRNLLMNLIESEKNPTIKSTLQTFVPVGTDLLNPPKFNFTKTVTGRMTVESGPAILTLPKDKRKIILPNAADSVLIEIDFISLEPRIALSIAGNVPTHDDVYEFINCVFFDNRHDRATIKIVTLGVLYGMSIGKISGMTRLSFGEAKKITATISKVFHVHKIVKDLQTQYLNNGKSYNLFGRPLHFGENTKTHVMYNHFIQSSAVDAAIEGFTALHKAWKKEISLKYMIHDALIVDVKKHDLIYLRELCSAGIEIPELGKFAMHTTVLEH